MRIQHYITFPNSSSQKAIKPLVALGIHIKKEKYGYRPLFIYDDDERWPEVRSILNSKSVSFQTWQEFSKKEIADAERVEVYCPYTVGYPMPDSNFDYKRQSYSPQSACDGCGIDLDQIAPIRLKREPSLGKNQFVSIEWEFEMFAATEIVEPLQTSSFTGFGFGDVLHHKTDEVLQNLKQIHIHSRLPPAVIDDNLTSEIRFCGHEKYHYPVGAKLRMSRDVFEDAPDLVMTHEWFGSGYSARRHVIGSKRFVQLYLENKWRGLDLKPVELVD